MIRKYSGFSIWLFAVIAVASALFCGEALGQASPRQPNVLVLFPDQHLHSVLGVAGDPVVLTPNLDRLAAGGIRFTRCAVAHPVCTPSRATIQTGTYAEVHGAFKNNERLEPPDMEYVAEAYAKAGYATGYIGKWHLDGGQSIDGDEWSFLFRPREESYVPPERRRGYQEWRGYEHCEDHDDPIFWDDSVDPPVIRHVFDEFGWDPSWQRASLLDFAERHGEAGQPWMYQISFGPPHGPDEAPQEWFDLYDRSTIPIPDWITQDLNDDEIRFARRKLHEYYAMISFVDDEVGKIMDGLEALGQLDNTIIAYTSDHGDLLGSHWDTFDNVPRDFRTKGVPFANAFRVPLIMHWPASIPAGLEVDALVSNVDIPLTLLSLAGVPIPSQMQGVDMREWCLGGIGPRRTAVYISYYVLLSPGWRGVWTGDYMYAPGDSHRVLFDHVADPLEEVNLVDRPEVADIQQELDDLLSELSVLASTPGRATPSSGGGGGGSCFIATAAYGTPLAPELDVLRGLRDQRLLTNAVGTAAVDAYYRLSPALADRVARAPGLAALTRALLVPVLFAAKTMGAVPGWRLFFFSLPVLLGLTVFRRRSFFG